MTDPARIEKLLSVVRATRPLPDASGVLYYASNITGRAQVFRMSSGSPPERVAQTESRMIPHAHSPLGLVVREDHGGDEMWQLGLIGVAGYRALTTDRRAIYRSAVLHPDKLKLGMSWNPNGQADMVLGELDLATGSITPWSQPGGFWEWAAWSPSGDLAAVVKLLGTPAEAYLLDREGTMRRLLPDAIRVHPVEWIEEGLLVMTDLGRDFLGLALVTSEKPDRIERWLLDEERELEGVIVAPSKDKALIVVNEGIYDGLRVIALDSGEVLDIVGLPRGLVVTDHDALALAVTGAADYHVSWTHDSSRLFVSWEQPTQPAEIYEWPGQKRLTFSSDLPADLVAPAETSYRTFDGLTIPSLFYRIDEQPRPAVVLFHGGPEGQARATYAPLVHLLTSIGVNVFLPNVRGSSGYGTHFQNLDDKKLRWNGVMDGSEAARHLKGTGAATKTAAMGSSYGGFMTLAVLIDDPDLWAAGVDTVGIADWHKFFANMPPWRGALRMSEYGDPNGAEADFLREISPIHRAALIKAPLLVIHGRNDPRVPVEESEVIALATGAELMIFDDEGHGIQSLPNQVKSNRRILEFFAKHLL